MSLKGGAELRASGLLVLVLKFEDRVKPQQWESGKRGFGFPLFHCASRLRECGNRIAISKGCGRGGKSGFGFPRRPQPVISAAVFMRSSSVEGRRRVFVWLLACSARRWCRCGHQPCAVSLRLSCQASGKPRNPGAAAILPRASRSGDKSGAPSLFCLLSFPVSHKADESSHVAGSNRGYEARHRSL